jgi:hypothetical protein
MTNPYVFVVGSPRSGTSLLGRMIEAHPQLLILHETQWIPHYFQERLGVSAEGGVLPELVAHVLGHRRFRTIAKWGVSPREIEALVPPGRSTLYADFVSALFDLCGRAQRKPLVGDKTPEYARTIGILHGLWPRAKFVHIIRDGRDICLSALDWKRKSTRMAELFPTWEQEPVLTAAFWWTRNVREARDRGRPLGPGLYYEVRYELLVTRPAEEAARLCAFLQVPYDASVLSFHEGRTRNEPGLSAKDAWLPITPDLRNWRTQMPAGDTELFEAAAGDLLEELGYPRACPQPRAQALERTAAARELFARYAEYRKSGHKTHHLPERESP